MASDFIWRPEQHAWTRDSHVARFMRTRGIASLAELRQASVHCYQWFWDEALRDMGLEWSRRYTQLRDVSGGLPWTRWFVGGEINLTHNCVDRHVRDGHGAETAIFYEPDSGRAAERRRITFAELADLVNRCVLALRAAGVQRGDPVALQAPMQVPTVVVLFASMKLGARFVPIPCGFGLGALRERLASCGATILFAARTLPRDGRATDTGAVAREAVQGAPSVTRIVWTDTAEWEEFLQSGGCLVPPRNPLAPGQEPAIPCERTAAEEPCLVLYTRGTTGRAKGTVHTHAGCLAQMGKDTRYAFDVRAGEPFFWVTESGGMMAAWELIGCLLYRTPVVLFDGAASSPDADRLWEICGRLGVVTLGVSPTLVRLLRRETGARGPRAFPLERLRVLGATGEVWDEADYRWFFEEVGGGRCPVVNMSGGTEFAGSLVQPYPVEPLKPCSVGGPALGMDVDIYTDTGESAPRGTSGHLVCKQPVPSMTKGLLHDEARYLETYFKRFNGVWYHGDRARVDEDGQWFLVGRTDDTFNVADDRAAEGASGDASQRAVVAPARGHEPGGTR